MSACSLATHLTQPVPCVVVPAGDGRRKQRASAGCKGRRLHRQVRCAHRQGRILARYVLYEHCHRHRHRQLTQGIVISDRGTGGNNNRRYPPRDGNKREGRDNNSNNNNNNNSNNNNSGGGDRRRGQQRPGQRSNKGQR